MIEPGNPAIGHGGFCGQLALPRFHFAIEGKELDRLVTARRMGREQLVDHGYIARTSTKRFCFDR